MRLITFSFLLLLHCIAYSQTRLTGTIKDKSTTKPIEYANIGIPEKGVGTVCNSEGIFELLVPNEFTNSSLVITHLGYKDLVVKIAELKPNQQILLEPSSLNLREVTISSLKDTILGYKPTDKAVQGFWKAAGLGGEAGTLIRNIGKAELLDFNLSIIKCSFDTIRFRVNLYTVKRNKPLKKINSKDIIFNITSNDTGHFSVPIAETIIANDNFICTIELIEIKGKSDEKDELLFHALSDPQGYIYRRMISLGRWEKFKGFDTCFWLSARK